MTQKQNKKTTNKTEGTNKKRQIEISPLTVIMILVIIILIVILVIKIKDVQNKENQQESGDAQETEQEMPEYSLIDMNNTENAKITGGTKENISSKLAEEKKYKGMTIKNIKLIAEGGITRLTATVENTSSSDYEGGGVNIIFINEDGTEYARLEGILPPIQKGATNELDAGTTADIANAYDFRIE